MKPYDEKRMMDAFKSCDFEKKEDKKPKLETQEKIDKFPSLEKIMEGYRQALHTDLEIGISHDIRRGYQKMIKIAEKTGCTGEDIAAFCEELNRHPFIYRLTRFVQRRKTGIYISALVNSCIDENETIAIKPPKKLHFIGSYLPRGTLIIDTDVGSHACTEMENSKVIIKGNAGGYLGILAKYGRIEVEGNVGMELGLASIFTRFDVGGRITNISTIIAGKVYRKGELIYKS